LISATIANATKRNGGFTAKHEAICGSGVSYLRKNSGESDAVRPAAIAKTRTRPSGAWQRVNAFAV